jgi:transglutaminase-like putative cysteine protease
VRGRGLLVAVMLSLTVPALAPAQFKEGGPQDAKLGEARVQRLQIGITVNAAGGPCRGIVGYTAVPDDWPEQQVRIVDEEVAPGVKVGYRVVDGMAKVMEVRIASLPAGEEAKAIVTFEVRRRPILPPDETDSYVLPDLKKLDRQIRVFLAPSPKIESRDRKIRALAKEIGAEKPKAWKKVEAIYDWVRDHVEYKNGPLKGALAALRDRTGDCEELTSLFVALCRASDVPARTVWVQGHCYPEFYLMDAKGKGRWFPCQAAGARAFGEIAEVRPILQKGDSIHPPYDRRTPKRYLADHLAGTGTAGQPRVRFIRRTVSQ